MFGMALERSTKQPLLSTHPPLLKAAGEMGIATALSRILGFGRDLLMAAAYGTSATAQAFVVAFRIPNLLRDLAGEGAANSALVPVFSRTRALEGESSWGRLAQAIWVRQWVAFIALLVVGLVAAPWIVKGVAPGFRQDPVLFAHTVQLTRILFPFVGLVGMAAFFMGLLNSAGRFALPSLGPALLNIGMIVGILSFRRDALGLAWGVIVGGLLQLAIQYPSLRRMGIRLNFKWQRHPGVVEIGRLLVPRMVGSGVYQIGVLVDTIFASFPRLVGTGGVASLYFAHRFLHLPLALFGISMAQAALPTLSTQAAAQDLKAIRRTCLLALRWSLFVAVPSSVGLVVLGRPIITTLLERGAFSSEASAMTIWALRYYALGLASLCAGKVLANTLYALHDTWTPVRSAAIALGFNVLLNGILIWPMGLSGLALATSIGSLINGLHLAQAVHRKVGILGDGLGRWLSKVLFASLGMGAVAGGSWALGICGIPILENGVRLGWLALSIIFAVGTFFGLGLFLRIEEACEVVGWLAERCPQRFRKS